MTIVVDPISLASALLSGGTAAMLVFIAIHCIWTGRRQPDVFFAVMFCLTTAAQAMVYTPVIEASMPGLTAALRPFGVFHTVFLWWFALALFDDEFKFQSWHLVPFVAIAGLIVAGTDTIGLLDNTTRQAATLLINIALFGHILAYAIFDYSGDLVDERRKFRLALTSVVPATRTR